MVLLSLSSYNNDRLLIGENHMIIKPSTSIRNHYSEISSLAKKTNEPIFITNNGEGDLVVMSMKAYSQIEDEKKILEAVFAGESELASGSKGKEASQVFRDLEKRSK